MVRQIVYARRVEDLDDDDDDSVVPAGADGDVVASVTGPDGVVEKEDPDGVVEEEDSDVVVEEADANVVFEGADCEAVVKEADANAVFEEADSTVVPKETKKAKQKRKSGKTNWQNYMRKLPAEKKQGRSGPSGWARWKEKNKTTAVKGVMEQKKKSTIEGKMKAVNKKKDVGVYAAEALAGIPSSISSSSSSRPILNMPPMLETDSEAEFYWRGQTVRAFQKNEGIGSLKLVLHQWLMDCIGWDHKVKIQLIDWAC